MPSEWHTGSTVLSVRNSGTSWRTWQPRYLMWTKLRNNKELQNEEGQSFWYSSLVCHPCYRYRKRRNSGSSASKASQRKTKKVHEDGDDEEEEEGEGEEEEEEEGSESNDVGPTELWLNWYWYAAWCGTGSLFSTGFWQHKLSKFTTLSQPCYHDNITTTLTTCSSPATNCILPAPSCFCLPLLGLF